MEPILSMNSSKNQSNNLQTKLESIGKQSQLNEKLSKRLKRVIHNHNAATNNMKNKGQKDIQE